MSRWTRGRKTTEVNETANTCWISAIYVTGPWWIATKKGPMRAHVYTVYPKKYAHGYCFAVLCCGYTLTDFPIYIRLTSLALWQSNDCPSASKATLMNMDKYFMWIHYERLHNHNKAKHNKTVCIFLGIYCMEGALHKMVVIVRTITKVLNLGRCGPRTRNNSVSWVWVNI